MSIGGDHDAKLHSDRITREVEAAATRTWLAVHGERRKHDVAILQERRRTRTPGEQLHDAVVKHLTRAQEQAPIDMVLHCPSCGLQHIDAPNEVIGWMNPPHRSHLCEKCGNVWRPADVPTNGVASVTTRSEHDGYPTLTRTQLVWERAQLEARVKQLAKGLQFYAEGRHFVRYMNESAWDTVSGEPPNFWCDEAGTTTVEDGSIAKLVLSGAEINWEEDAPKSV